MDKDHPVEANAAELHQVPRTLADLLQPLPTDLEKKNLLPMLRRTGDLIAEHRRKSLEQIEIQALVEMQESRREPGGFREFLTKKK